MTWSTHFTWELVLPPSRPSRHDLAVVTRHLNPLERDVPVCVMGSTPEFRDTAARLGFSDVTVVDSSREFHAYSESLRCFNTEDNETYINADWREYFPGISKQFGAILSDLTMGNIPYADRDHLYRAIERSLSPGGLYIDKVLTRQGPLYTSSELRKIFDASPLNLASVNDFNCRALFCHAFQGEAIASSSRYDELATDFADHPVILKHIELCEKITPRGMTWYYGRNWSEVSRQYLTSALLVDQVPQPVDTPYYGHAQTFVFQSRKDY